MHIMLGQDLIRQETFMCHIAWQSDTLVKELSKWQICLMSHRSIMQNQSQFSKTSQESLGQKLIKLSKIAK